MFGGGDDDKDDTDFSWGGIGGDDDTAWGGDLNDINAEDFGDLADRYVEGPGGGESVQEFYDINSLMEYLEGTPETVLKFWLDPEEEVYYVERYDSV